MEHNGVAWQGSRPNDAGDHVPVGLVTREPSDIEHCVRQALADHLTRSPHLPPMLAQSLATDVLSVPLGRYPEQADATSDCNARGGPAADQEKHRLSEVNHQIDAVSGALRDYLVNRRELPPALLDEMIMLGRERALTGAIDNDIPSQDLERLATDLIAEDRLTPTLLLRSLCLGKLRFFEAAMAALTATTVERVQAMTYEEGANDFFQLYELAALPNGFYRAFRATIGVILQFGRNTARGWQRDLTGEIISSLVKEYDQVSPEDLEHVLSQLSRGVRPPTVQNELPA